MIGIILLGQPELKYLLDEAMHPELREVIRRCTMAEITDLGGEVGSYLKYKFDRVAAGRFDEIFEPDCITAVLQRLPDKAFPLSVNNLAARSMNLAAEMGEAKVTAEVVLAA
jgi:type II secretory pathway predicted ATPase ExeA